MKAIGYLCDYPLPPNQLHQLMGPTFGYRVHFDLGANEYLEKHWNQGQDISLFRIYPAEMATVGAS